MVASSLINIFISEWVNLLVTYWQWKVRKNILENILKERQYMFLNVYVVYFWGEYLCGWLCIEGCIIILPPPSTPPPTPSPNPWPWQLSQATNLGDSANFAPNVKTGISYYRFSFARIDQHLSSYPCGRDHPLDNGAMDPLCPARW